MFAVYRIIVTHCVWVCLEMAFYVSFEMLVRREARAALNHTALIRAIGRFRSLSLEPKTTTVLLLTSRYQKRASVGFRLMVHSLDVGLQVGIAKEGFVAVRAVLGALKWAVPRMRPHVFVQPTWSCKGLVAAAALPGAFVFWRKKTELGVERSGCMRRGSTFDARL